MRFFLITGFSMLGLAFYWPKFYDSLKPVGVLATVVSAKGTNEWISRKTLQPQTPQKASLLRLNESLATGSDGEMVLRFKRGAEIRLLPSSFITLIRKANSTLIALRRGEIEVIREGESRSVLISQDGQDKALRDYLSPSSQEPLWIDPQSLDTIKTVTPYATPLAASQSLEGSEFSASTYSSGVLRMKQDLLAPLSDSEVKNFQTQIRQMIADRIQRQKNHLFRCYSQLIQKQKDLQGKVDLHFTVNNLGKVESPLIVKAEIVDKKFHSCLLHVVKRTDFQPFQGPKVSTLLPLRFDKNLTSEL